MEPRLGIYIHIPFCASKCGYCDFYSCAGAADRMADYQHALLEHIEESAGRIAPAYIDTVYFGGGTPSFYGAARLIEVLDAVISEIKPKWRPGQCCCKIGPYKFTWP